MTTRIIRLAAFLIALLTPLDPVSAGWRGGIGVLGDSYSDEYQFYPPHRSTARNWVEILAATWGLNFGRFSTRSRGEPRNQGYEYNWARSDATTDDLIVTGQHTGRAAQVAHSVGAPPLSRREVLKFAATLAPTSDPKSATGNRAIRSAAGSREVRARGAEPAIGIPADGTDAGPLSMPRPYARGKVPVVLIHGLWSGPRSWARMVEEFEADPVLRESYQFWTLSYPTGEPILCSASVLRRALLQARERYDPDGADPAFDRMVLIGHSLGGLLAKAMAQDSGSRLWETVSTQPADRLEGPAEARQLLRQALVFRPVPGVRRIIFIATPHRGSSLDRGAVHALGTRLVRHAPSLQRAYEALLESNGPDFFLDAFRDGLPTSVDQLTWGHPRLLSLHNLGIDPTVEYHSILADRRDPPSEGGTDGVVPYASARLDGAASELVVHGGHLCQDHPLVVRECRRILTEHLGPIVPQLGGSRAGVLDADLGTPGGTPPVESDRKLFRPALRDASGHALSGHDPFSGSRPRSGWDPLGDASHILLSTVSLSAHPGNPGSGGVRSDRDGGAQPHRIQESISFGLFH